MTNVDPRHVMALRRLCGQSVVRCRDELAADGGDLSAVIRRIRYAPGGIFATDAEVTEVLASQGIAYVPEVRVPVILSDDEVVERLTASGREITDYFLIKELVCSVNAHGELMATVIEDLDLAVSAKAYLRRIGAQDYPSPEAYEARREAAQE